MTKLDQLGVIATAPKEVRPNLMAYGITAQKVKTETSNLISIHTNASSASSGSSHQTTEASQDPGSTGSNGSISTETTTAEQNDLFAVQDEEVVV